MTACGNARREEKRMADRKKNGRRTYVVTSLAYLVICVLILAVGFLDVRDTVKTYNMNQARLVSTLLVENVNEALDNIVTQVEQVSRAIAGGHERDSEIIYEELLAYQMHSDVCSIGYVDREMNLYGPDGDFQDLVKYGFLKKMTQTAQTMVTDPYRSKISADNVITVFVPVYKKGARTGTVYANLPLQTLQDFAGMGNFDEEANIYLIDCHSLNCISCTDSEMASAGTWNNLALRQAYMEFDSEHDYRFYISKMQNGVKGDMLSYRIDGIAYSQGYERIEKMKGWYLAVELSNRSLSDSFDAFQGKLVGYAVILLVVTLAVGIFLILLETLQKKNFEKLSSTDAMTGLYNKKTFTALVEDYVREKKEPGVLIFVDVDNFKVYNDNYGHLNGDAVLKKFARELQAEFGDGGIIGRYGGDEFIVFLTHTEDRARVEKAMKRLQGALASMELEGFGTVALSFSSGGVCFPKDGADFKELCKMADDALYRVKEDGKGRFYWYR